MDQIICNATNVIIGIPSKGHLKLPIIAFLAKFGFKLELKKQRQLQAGIIGYPNYKVVLAHPMDIPLLLKYNSIDVGFTGLDIIKEMKIKLRPVVKTNCGRIKMCLLVPNSTELNHPFHLIDKTIATPFPSITQEYFDKLKVNIKLHPIRGSSEYMPHLGFVDGVVDVVATGISAISNGLKIIVDDIFDSECVAVVSKPELHSNYIEVNNFLRRIYQ